VRGDPYVSALHQPDDPAKGVAHIGMSVGLIGRVGLVFTRFSRANGEAKRRPACGPAGLSDVLCGWFVQ
jgi:hypothetical protein